MAAIRGSRLSYLLNNFTNFVANQRSNFNKSCVTLFHCSSLLFGPGKEVKMPSLSPTMEEGKIVKWLKKEGDIVNPGDILCDIETDKAIVSMDTEEEGILAKIIVPENTPNIKVGSLIALMVDKDEDWKNVDIPAEAKVSMSGSPSSSSDFNEVSSSEDVVITGPSATPIKMPALSPTMTVGTIVKWLKKEGDKITAGDELCEIQTDKAVMFIEAEEDGILAKIIMPNDTKDIKVGTPIAVIVPEGEDWKSVVVTSKPSAEKKTESPPSGGTAGSTEVKSKIYGPAVKVMLAEYQIEPGHIKATGRANRLLKEDVLKYIADNNLQKKPPKPVLVSSRADTATCLLKNRPKKIPTIVSKYEDIQLTNVKQTLGKKLLQSKLEIPHIYLAVKCEVDKLAKAEEALINEGAKVSSNDLLTKAVGLALQMYPKANSFYINNEVKLSQSVDICITVSTDAGLYTPVIKAVNTKNVLTISEEIKKLAEKARNGELSSEEFQNGTFTISNLGMFGIAQFKAVILPPQCGILGVGSTTETLGPDMEIKRNMMLSLSCDRRILQEDEAAQFMDILKYFIENPKLITQGLNQSMHTSL